MLRSILVLGIVLVGIVASFRSAFAALLLYVWFALFRPQEWVWFDIESFRLSLLIGVLLVARSLISGVLPNFTHPLSLGAMGFLGTALLAQINAVRPDIGWFWIDFLARLVLVCLLMVSLAFDRRRLFLVMAVIAISFGFHSGKAGLASMLGGGVRYFDGLGGGFIDNNAYALGIVMVMPLLINVALNSTRRSVQIVFLLIAALSAFTVVSLFSRGGFLALATCIAVYAALSKRRLKNLSILIALGILAVLFVPIPKGYLDRVKTIRTYEEVEDESAMSRPHFWGVAVAMAVRNPLGIGVRNFEVRYDDYDWTSGRYGRGRSVHSSHFQVLAENGFLGFGVYAGMFAYALLVCFRVRRLARAENLEPDTAWFLHTSATALIASMSGFLVGGAFIAMAHNDLTWYTFGLVASLDYVAQAAGSGSMQVDGPAADFVEPRVDEGPRWK